MWVATFLGVTFAGVEIGIAIGVGLSFLYVGLKVGSTGSRTVQLPWQ